jgi:hypothetical protein
VAVAVDGDESSPDPPVSTSASGVEDSDGLTDVIVGVGVTSLVGSATLIGADMRIGVGVALEMGVDVGVMIPELNSGPVLIGAELIDSVILKTNGSGVPVWVGVAVGVEV